MRKPLNHNRIHLRRTIHDAICMPRIKPITNYSNNLLLWITTIILLFLLLISEFIYGLVSQQGFVPHWQSI